METPAAPVEAPFDPRGLVDSWDAAIGKVAAENPAASVASGSKRGPSGPRAPSVPSVTVAPEKLGAMMRPVFRIVCDMAKVDRVTDDELRDWAEASAPFAEKYLGKLLQERAEVVAFVFATLVLTAPRIEQGIAAHKADKERRAEVTASKEF